MDVFFSLGFYEIRKLNVKLTNNVKNMSKTCCRKRVVSVTEGGLNCTLDVSTKLRLPYHVVCPLFSRTFVHTCSTKYMLMFAGV